MPARRTKSKPLPAPQRACALLLRGGVLVAGALLADAHMSYCVIVRVSWPLGVCLCVFALRARFSVWYCSAQMVLHNRGCVTSL